MFKILLTKRALKDLESIQDEMKKTIGLKLKELASDPMRYARKLSNPKIGTFRFRIGDYRIIFDIKDEEIIILRIGHRSKIYR